MHILMVKSKSIPILLYSIIYCLLNLGSFTSSLKYESKTQDAWLYPGIQQQGIHLRFSDSVDWSDLWQLMSEKGFFTAGKLCVRGVFVLYREPLFAVPKPNTVEIFSGNMRCTVISENTKSIQMTGSVGKMYGPSITFFQKPYFGSEGYPTVLNVGSDFFEKMEYTRSAILVGRTPWTLKFSTGETICVLPEFDPSEISPICLIRDFTTLFGDENADDDALTDNDKEENLKNQTVVLQATQGCKKALDEESIFRIQDCMYFGKPRKPKEAPITFEDNSALAGRAGSSDFLCSNKDETKRLFLLYKAAITKRFDTDVLVGLDKIGKHSWKLDLLDWIFTIVNHIIPEDAIPEAFLNKVRETFVHKLITVWDENEVIINTNTSLLEKNYKDLLLLTEDCETKILETPTDKQSSKASIYSQEFTRMWEGIPSLQALEKKVTTEFKRRTDLDIVSEMVWIVGHMAGFVCHNVHMMSSHYWALFFNIFWNLYMNPVRTEWAKVTQDVGLFFGGTNMEEEYLKLAMFAQVTRVKALKMELMPRPIAKKKKVSPKTGDADAPKPAGPSF